MQQRILTPQELKEIDLLVRSFGSKTKDSLAMQINKLGLRSRAEVFSKIKESNNVKKHLAESFKVKYKRRFGQVDSVIFTYNWYGLFHDIGTDNAFGTGVNLPKLDWKAAVINPAANKLANHLQKFYANAAVRAIEFSAEKK